MYDVTTRRWLASCSDELPTRRQFAHGTASPHAPKLVEKLLDKEQWSTGGVYQLQLRGGLQPHPERCKR
jgi:hypothetical protein